MVHTRISYWPIAAVASANAFRIHSSTAAAPTSAPPARRRPKTAAALMRRNRPVDPLVRGQAYRKAGWTRFDERAPPTLPPRSNASVSFTASESSKDVPTEGLFSAMWGLIVKERLF
jgi:hypothetical protein